MAQTFTTGSLSSGASGPNETDVVIPANSQIVDVVIDIAVATTGVTTRLNVGDTVGGDTSFINDFTMALSPGVVPNEGRRYPTTQGGGALAWADTGDEDVRITWTTTGASTGGEIRVTVLYQQAINLVA